jgi:tRNA G18 (ribose-2'-O)-methylase SpoU
VLVPRSRTAPLTPAARKTASGAAETVPLIAAANLARTLRWLVQRGLRIVGLAGEGEAAPWDAALRSGCLIGKPSNRDRHRRGVFSPLEVQLLNER